MNVSVHPPTDLHRIGWPGGLCAFSLTVTVECFPDDGLCFDVFEVDFLNFPINVNIAGGVRRVPLYVWLSVSDVVKQRMSAALDLELRVSHTSVGASEGLRSEMRRVSFLSELPVIGAVPVCEEWYTAFARDIASASCDERCAHPTEIALHMDVYLVSGNREPLPIDWSQASPIKLWTAMECLHDLESGVAMDKKKVLLCINAEVPFVARLEVLKHLLLQGEDVIEEISHDATFDVLVTHHLLRTSVAEADLQHVLWLVLAEAENRAEADELVSKLQRLYRILTVGDTALPTRQLLKLDYLDSTMWDWRRPLIPFLLRAGANPNAIGHQNMTPLLMACKLGNVTPVKQLLDGGADPDMLCDSPLDTYPTVFKSITPLMIAVFYSYVPIVHALLKGKCNVNARNKVGYTALHIAIMQGDEKMYMELLAAGAKMAPKDGSPSFLMDMLRLRVEAEDLRIVLEHRTSFPPQVQDSIAREFTPGLKAEVRMERATEDARRCAASAS